MKKILGILFGLASFFSAFSHEDEAHLLADSLSVMDKLAEVSMYNWKSVGPLGYAESASIDTFLQRFHVSNPAEKNSVAFQHLGNLGSPGVSRIFFDRKNKSEFLFFKPYEAYYFSPEDLLYFNTKRPYSNVSYYSGGKNDRMERRVNGVFTVNVNRNLNLGMYGDWVNGYGQYESQSTRNYNAGFFGSYMGRNHNLMANLSFNGYESYENGGLIDARQVTDPKNTGMIEPINMSVYMPDNAWSTLRNINAYLNYKYNIGFDKKRQVTADSTVTEFIPVTSIVYTFRYEHDKKTYRERSLLASAMPVDSFYKAYGLGSDLNINGLSTLDSSRFSHMRHVVGVSLNEEYNTLAKFGLAAYGVAEIKKYGFMSGTGHSYSDSLFYEDFYDRGRIKNGMDSAGYFAPLLRDNLTRTKYGVGASLSKHSGKHLFYNFSGEYYFLNEKEEAGSFMLNGDVRTEFVLFKKPVILEAEAEYKSECADFFEEFYFSNHISWNRRLSDKQTFSLRGRLSLPSIGLTLKSGFASMADYVYFNQHAVPEQGDVSVFDFTVREDLKLGFFHWDNELVYQYTSDEDVLPLPELSLYSNMYLQFDKLFKVLTVQVGADLRWHSGYYAQLYMPATGMFFSQRKSAPDESYNSSLIRKIGDYPFMNAYLSFHLKTFRVFVVYNHINLIWDEGGDYLSLPGYAYNPSFLKFGISVNLAD